jgi:hypothetical protein
VARSSILGKVKHLCRHGRGAGHSKSGLSACEAAYREPETHPCTALCPHELSWLSLRQQRLRVLAWRHASGDGCDMHQATLVLCTE